MSFSSEENGNGGRFYIERLRRLSNASWLHLSGRKPSFPQNDDHRKRLTKKSVVNENSSQSSPLPFASGSSPKPAGNDGDNIDNKIRHLRIVHEYRSSSMATTPPSSPTFRPSSSSSSTCKSPGVKVLQETTLPCSWKIRSSWYSAGSEEVNPRQGKRGHESSGVSSIEEPELPTPPASPCNVVIQTENSLPPHLSPPLPLKTSTESPSFIPGFISISPHPPYLNSHKHLASNTSSASCLNIFDQRLRDVESTLTNLLIQTANSPTVSTDKSSSLTELQKTCDIQSSSIVNLQQQIEALGLIVRMMEFAVWELERKVETPTMNE